MGDQIVVTQHFTSGPPAVPFTQGGDNDTVAIEKQEEWIKKRKVEQVTTKQIETRIKRQVLVTEDGTVLDDSGPQVTTNTTEDTQTKREEHTEKKGGDEDGTVALIPEGWVPVPGAVIIREKHEKKCNTRDETNERLETEEVHHLGPITNEELEDVLENQRETGQLAVLRRRQSSSNSDSNDDHRHRQQHLITPYSSEKRIVHQSRKHKRIIDQENTEERSEEKDGKISTETTKHEHHEEVEDEELPDPDLPASVTSSVHEVVKETRNNYTTNTDEDQVEYIAVPKGGNVLTSGIKLGRGPRHSTQQTVQYDETGIPNSIPLIPTPVAVASPQPAVQQLPASVQPPVAERTDALTKQPLDLEAEEETRKLETSRWLESHFGSESSFSSAEGGDKKPKNKMPVSQQVSSGGINVTMTSDPQGSDRYEAPTFPAPPPPPISVLEPPATSRIYATTGSSSNVMNRTAELSKTINQAPPRYASVNERVQVLPVGPDKLFTRNSFGSPPATPTYQKPQISSAGYQSAWNLNHQPAPNQSSGRPELFRNLSGEGNSSGNPSAVTVKRAASFNPNSNKPDFSWMTANREESSREQHSSLTARHSFLSSMNNNNNNSDYGRQVGEPKSYGKSTEMPTYSTPIVRRWPPPPNRDDDEEEEYDRIRSSTPVNQKKGGTVIRLGPENTNSNISPIRKNSGGGINRTQSMFNPSQHHQPMSTSNRMNLINSSLQSVPERERSRPDHDRPKSGTYFIDIERSFSSLGPNKSKIIQSSPAKTPPPRPAPPSHYGSLSRTSESFRIPKSPPMFANELDGNTPPVRPVRRNKSKRVSNGLNKTDSGTQTILPSSNTQHQTNTNEYIKGLEMMSRTLERPTGKPIKQYYMGEDPFKNRRSVSPVNKPVNGHLMEPYQPPRGTKSTEIVRSQTLPRRPSKPSFPSENESPVHMNSKSQLNSSQYSDRDRSINETYRLQYNAAKPKVLSETKRSPSPPSNLQRSSNITSVVNRSQSFHAENQQRRLSSPFTSSTLTGPNRPINTATPPIKSNLTSRPLYKSTSFLNRLNTTHNNEQFGSLKSPGIVTSISKSQLDLTNSNMHSSGALYTLPRRRSPVKDVPPTQVNSPPQPTGPIKAPTGISDNVTQVYSTTDGPRETYSSMHRRKMQAASAGLTEPKKDQELNGQLNFQTSTKTTSRVFQPPQAVNETISEETEPEAKSLKDRIAMLESAGIQYASSPAQTLPRVVAGKTKPAPPPPPPRVNSVLSTPSVNMQKQHSPPPLNPQAESFDPAGEVKREKFLKGLLSTAPELFMHIHGDEDLKDVHVKRDDVIDGKHPARLPFAPSPPPPPPPPPAYNNKVFTATTTPASHTANSFSKSPVDPPSPGRSGLMDTSAPLTPPPPLLSVHSGGLRNSPFGSQHDLALRRGSLNSNGSSSIIPAVRIPPPVNYSETVRIKSNQDPDSQSDSVQSYSKRVQPFADGFSSETKQSSQQTTLTRSHYSTPAGSHNMSPPSTPFQIRPQESGGVIISVRGNGQ